MSNLRKLTLLVLSACKSPSVLTDGYVSVQMEKRKTKKWKLVWQDDLNGSNIDTAKWSKIPFGGSDCNRHMSNNENCYTVRDGQLYLIGINNPDALQDPRPFLTGGVYTKGKFAFQYMDGLIKAKLESAQGPLFGCWLNRTNTDYTPKTEA